MFSYTVQFSMSITISGFVSRFRACSLFSGDSFYILPPSWFIVKRFFDFFKSFCFFIDAKPIVGLTHATEIYLNIFLAPGQQPMFGIQIRNYIVSLRRTKAFQQPVSSGGTLV